MSFQSVSKRFEPIKVVKDKSSNTVPDMAYTPREIITKFSRGEKVPLGFNGLYDSEDDPNMDKYELDKSMFEDDPTRDPSFDFGDYVEEKYALKERQKAEKLEKLRAKKEKEKEEKKLPSSQRKASAEEVSASDPTKRETISGDDGNSPREDAPK